jgi:hypothetical protein
MCTASASSRRRLGQHRSLAHTYRLLPSLLDTYTHTNLHATFVRHVHQQLRHNKASQFLSSTRGDETPGR